MENGGLRLALSIDAMDNGTATAASTDQVRTLFVSGLPLDVKQRELYLIFRICPGYERSLLRPQIKNGKKSSPVGFVTFASYSDAEKAKNMLQGFRVDPESTQTLRLEIARSNTKEVKQKRITPPAVSITQPSVTAANIQAAERLLQSVSAHATPHNFLHTLPTSNAHDLIMPPNCIEPQTMISPLFADQLLAFAQQQPLLLPAASAAYQLATAPSVFQPNPAAFVQFTAASQAAAQLAAASQQAIAAHAVQLGIPNHFNLLNTKSFQSIESPPNGCSTLFVANLNNTSENDLKDLFSKIPGFSSVRLLSKGVSPPVAFVDFKDVSQARHAMEALQGIRLKDSAGLRIEFAKNKMSDVTRDL